MVAIEGQGAETRRVGARKACENTASNTRTPRTEASPVRREEEDKQMLVQWRRRGDLTMALTATEQGPSFASEGSFFDDGSIQGE